MKGKKERQRKKRGGPEGGKKGPKKDRRGFNVAQEHHKKGETKTQPYDLANRGAAFILGREKEKPTKRREVSSGEQGKPYW